MVWLTVAAGMSAIPVGLVDCFQQLDPNLASGSPADASGSGDGARHDGGIDAGLMTCTAGEICQSPGTMQCPLDSPECFYLCGSPQCAIGPDPNNPEAGITIPPLTEVPPIYIGSADSLLFGDGSVTLDPCAQVVADSLAIRRKACAPCHTGAPPAPSQGFGNFNFILNDQMLVDSTSASGLTTDSGALASYVVPGDPWSSLVYQRVAGGTMPPNRSLCESLIGPEAGAGIAYPTPSELSILYGWIQNCVPGTDGGAYASSSYGGGYGGTTCFGPCGDAGTSD